MYLLILPAVSKNIIDKGRKSIWLTVSLRTYYGRKKYPDPPIINTDNTHMSCRNFQRSSTLNWYCLRYMHGLAYRMA